MQIVIMRHGEAESGFASGGGDAQRQLTETGHRQTVLAGERLQESGFAPEEIWVSPYLRTQQTATNVLQAYGSSDFLTQPFLVPDAHTAEVVDAMSTFSDKALLLVSHMPLVANLVSVLSGEDVYTVPAMAPASMVALQCEEPLAGCCDILWQRHSPDFVVTY